MSNVRKYALDRKYLKDYFDKGRVELKDIVKDQKEELNKEEKKIELIYDAVRYFQRRIDANLDTLDQILKAYEE